MWGDFIECTLSFQLGAGVEPLTKFSNEQGEEVAWQDLNFSRGLLGKRGWVFSSKGGCSFSIKNKLKPKYLTTKTFISKNTFLSKLRIKTAIFWLRIWLLLKDEMGLRMKNFNVIGFY